MSYENLEFYFRFKETDLINFIIKVIEHVHISMKINAKIHSIEEIHSDRVDIRHQLVK